MGQLPMVKSWRRGPSSYELTASQSVRSMRNITLMSARKCTSRPFTYLCRLLHKNFVGKLKLGNF